LLFLFQGKIVEGGSLQNVIFFWCT